MNVVSNYCSALRLDTPHNCHLIFFHYYVYYILQVFMEIIMEEDKHDLLIEVRIVRTFC